MNILIVEDETRVADFVQRGLRGEGWTVEHVLDGEAALELLQAEHYDVILLDLMLPGVSGLEVCRRIRARSIVVPVMMLSALDGTDEKIAGLQAGADDYLTKPFEFDELIARIKALHRRHNAYKSQDDDPILTLGNLAFNNISLQVSVDGRAIGFTAKERDILRLMMSSVDRVFSRERILSAVWSVQEDPMTNIVDVYIGRLRKKLEGSNVQISTVRGIGYRMSLADDDR